MIKCCNFHTLGGGTSLVMTLGNRQTNRSGCFDQFSSSIDKVSFKRNNMSCTFLEFFMWALTLQSDAMSADIKIASLGML